MFSSFVNIRIQRHSTDAQFWDELQGGFDEKTIDDVDVDITGYLDPGMPCCNVNIHNQFRWLILVYHLKIVVLNI